MKARLHWSPDSTAADRHVEAVECEAVTEVAAAVAAMRGVGAEPVLQHRVDGRLMAMSVLIARDGRLLAASQQETARLSIRRTSVYARTLPVDPGLLESVLALLAELRWYGLANLQFLRPPDGDPHLIDFNPRFYGSLALAIRSGADYPSLWVRDALGEALQGPAFGRPGVRFHALEEDLRRARRERRGGLLHDLFCVAAAVPSSAHTSWAVSDPVPGLRRIRGLARLALDRKS